MFWKKKSRELKIEIHTKAVLNNLIYDSELVFTHLELVQMSNDLRRLLFKFINDDKLECMSKSLEFNQKASDIEKSLELME